MQERTQYGGMANASYDPCYHRKCDTIENVAQVVLMQNAKVIGAVIDDLINTRIQLRQVFGTSLEEQNDMSLQLLEHDLLHTMQESR